MHPWRIAAGLGLVAVVAAAALGGCGSTRSFAQLRADAVALPVPSGLAYVHLTQSIEDGPGFTTAKFEEVAVQYRNSLACSELSQAWDRALRGAGRQFRPWGYPHMSGDAGLFGISVLDRPEHLGVTLGQYYRGAQQCRSPFIYAFNNPH